jgi:hypothetical protein
MSTIEDRTKQTNTVVPRPATAQRPHTIQTGWSRWKEPIIKYCEPVWGGSVVTGLLWLSDEIAAATHHRRLNLSGFVVGLVEHADNHVLVADTALLLALAFLFAGWVGLGLFRSVFVMPVVRFTRHATSAAAGAILLVGVVGTARGDDVAWADYLSQSSIFLMVAAVFQLYGYWVEKPHLFVPAPWQRALFGFFFVGLLAIAIGCFWGKG